MFKQRWLKQNRIILFQYPKLTQLKGQDLFSFVPKYRLGNNVFKLQKSKFWFLIIRTIQSWNQLFIEVVDFWKLYSKHESSNPILENTLLRRLFLLNAKVQPRFFYHSACSWTKGLLIWSQILLPFFSSTHIQSTCFKC